MKNQITILIVDDNVEFGNLLYEHIQQEKDIHIAGIARDGLEAIDMIKSTFPDIVILDVIMPNLDGIGVLEKLLSLNIEPRPIFIMLSAIGQDVFIRKAISLGAEYYIVKPFDINVLITRIRQVYSERKKEKSKNLYFSNSSRNTSNKVSEKNDLEQSITAALLEAGILPHMSGYHYVREAILCKIKNSKEFCYITKTLYPEVAKKFNTTPQKVERAIRKAIDAAWSRIGSDKLNSVLGNNFSFIKGKPTNAEFIAAIADRVRISSRK